MLSEYLDKAMEQAVYEIMEEDKLYWGEIPGLQGVWGMHENLEGCRRELRETLRDWIAFSLKKNMHIPIIAGIDLNQIDQPVLIDKLCQG